MRALGAVLVYRDCAWSENRRGCSAAFPSRNCGALPYGFASPLINITSSQYRADSSTSSLNAASSSASSKSPQHEIVHHLRQFRKPLLYLSHVH